MAITYRTANVEDVEPIYEFCKKLVQDYERLESIDYNKVMEWVHKN